jgi:hypothetical protein
MRSPTRHEGGLADSTMPPVTWHHIPVVEDEHLARDFRIAGPGARVIKTTPPATPGRHREETER